MSVKYTNSKQIELLSLCLLEIEKKLDWPNSEEWRNSHFELLSEKLFEETQVQLSPVTLKRLWGRVSYHSFPATSTLDVLAKFLGFENWIYYQQHTERTRNKTEQELSANNQVSTFKKVGLGAVILVFLFGLTQFASIQGAAVLSLNNGNIKFEFAPVTDELPNTVVFNYDVKETQADSVFIQQSWDDRLRQKVDKAGKVHTATYYYPGFYKAKLLLNKEVVSEKDLYIKSKGWLAAIEKKPVPFYLDKQEVAAPGFIQTTSQHLTSRGYDLHGEIPYSSFHMVKDFGNISGNNFNLRTRFKNTFGEGNAICQKSSLVILCSETPFIIPFAKKGCVGELDLYIPGKSISGKTNDLSAFGADFSDWVDLKVSVENKALDIQMNNRPIFHDTLLQDPGKIVGVRYKFHGTGAINSLKISSPSQPVFEANFDSDL